MLNNIWKGLKEAGSRLKSTMTLQKNLRPVEVTTPREETVAFYINFNTATGENVVKMHTNHLGIRDHDFVLGLRYTDTDGNRL